MEVPLLSINESLTAAIRNARLQRRIRFGFDDIFDKLAAEKKGIDEMLQKNIYQQNYRVSRLLLFSNDGAERLYRHIEQILTEHSLRECIGSSLEKLLFDNFQNTYISRPPPPVHLCQCSLHRTKVL